jgi:multidrug resistance efflux pump
MEKAESKNGLVEKKKGLLILTMITVLIAGIVGIFYWQTVKDQVYVEKSGISAPLIVLSSEQGGELKNIFVKIGDTVPAGFAVAQIGNEIIRTVVPGLVVQAESVLGKNFSPNESVVTIINPQDLRVVAQVEENKGLNRIVVGQQAVFTVDAFGGRKFFGVVDEIAETSRDSGVVFNISDKREVKIFDVKIRFDEKQYPELKNGMSAKVWIHTK